MKTAIYRGFWPRQLAVWTLLATSLAVCFGPRPASADYPHWRGPTRDGILTKRSGFAGGKWPGKELWSKGVGMGSTSPIVAGGKVYSFGWWDERDTLLAFDLASGEAAWRQSYAAPKYGRQAVGDEGFYEGPSATPEFDPATGLLYTLGIDGELRAWNTKEQGKLVWALNLYDKYDIPRRPLATTFRGGRRDYGYTCAPLVQGDWLLVEVGDDEGNLMAFDKRTGDRRWTSQSKHGAGHSGGIVPMTVEGVPCVAVLTLTHLVVTRLDKGNEGKQVAAHLWSTDFANNIPTPAVLGNEVLVTTRYNHETICKLAITLAGGAKVVWEKPHASGVCSPVIHRGHIYWVGDKVMCLDYATGDLVWSGGKFGDAGSCLATSDDRLIAWGGNGTLALVETAARSPQAYKELARLNNLASTDVWPHVALSDGYLICKDRQGKVRCFGVK